MAERVKHGSIKNKNGEYVWWYVLWRLPNFFFEARGNYLDGERDETMLHWAQARAVLGVGALVYIAYAYPGYLRGVQEIVATRGRLWPGVGTILKFSSTWETTIVYSLFLSAVWIILFALLILPITTPRALPRQLLNLGWSVLTILLFSGAFFLVAKLSDWVNNVYYGSSSPGFAESAAFTVGGIVVYTVFLKSVYLIATDVFRGDDAHPLLAPFVTTGVSWTLAYLAFSSAAPSEVPADVRVLATLAGPLSVTGINLWACHRIRRDNDGRLLFLDGPDGGRTQSAAAANTSGAASTGTAASTGGGGPARREILRLAVPSAVVLCASPWWAPKALGLTSTRSDQVLAYLNYTPTSNTLASRAAVTSMAFSPDGRMLVAGTSDGTVQLWNVTDPAHPSAVLPPLSTSTDIFCVAYSAHGHTVASGGDIAIQLWDFTDPSAPVALGDPLQTQHEIVGVAFSPTGRILAAASNDGIARYGVGAGIIQLWDVTDPSRPAALGSSGIAGEGYSSVALSPDGRTLASGSMLSAVQLWDVADPARPVVMHTIRTSTTSGYTYVAYSPAGHILAGGNCDGAVYLWDIADPARPVALGPPLAIVGEVSSLAFGPDGRTLAATSNRGYSNLGPYGGPGTIHLWDVSHPSRPSGPAPFAGAGVPGFSSVAFSPDGRTLASSNDAIGDGTSTAPVRLWDITDRARPKALGQPLS